MEAQRFPADYDGIVAGAPAYNWTHLLSAGLDDMNALLTIPPATSPRRSCLPLKRPVWTPAMRWTE